VEKAHNENNIKLKVCINKSYNYRNCTSLKINYRGAWKNKVCQGKGRSFSMMFEKGFLISTVLPLPL
jgi:hypothetical protein